MPVTLTYKTGSTTYTDTWTGFVTLGNVKIDYVNDLNNLSASLLTNEQFRYVIIPGNVVALAHINIKNYAEVKQALHLPD